MKITNKKNAAKKSSVAWLRSFYAKYDAEAKEWQRKAAAICGVKKVKSR